MREELEHETVLNQTVRNFNSKHWTFSLHHIYISFSFVSLILYTVVFSPYIDLTLVRPVLNSPTLQFSYIIIYIYIN